MFQNVTKAFRGIPGVSKRFQKRTRGFCFRDIPGEFSGISELKGVFQGISRAFQRFSKGFRSTSAGFKEFQERYRWFQVRSWGFIPDVTWNPGPGLRWKLIINSPSWSYKKVNPSLPKSPMNLCYFSFTIFAILVLRNENTVCHFRPTSNLHSANFA